MAYERGCRKCMLVMNIKGTTLTLSRCPHNKPSIMCIVFPTRKSSAYTNTNDITNFQQTEELMFVIECWTIFENILVLTNICGMAHPDQRSPIFQNFRFRVCRGAQYYDVKPSPGTRFWVIRVSLVMSICGQLNLLDVGNNVLIQGLWR